MKNLSNKRSRLNRRKSFIKRHLPYWKLYLSLAILSGVAGYIILLGTIEFTHRLFSFVAEAPTVAHAQEVAGESASLKIEVKYPTLNPNETEREQNIGLIKKIWGRDQEIGLAIAKCESGYRTHAVGHNTNGTIDEGIFQANSVHGMPEMQVAVANISYAYTLFLKQGTTPWDSSKHCWGGLI
jgi:hypothetical protein